MFGSFDSLVCQPDDVHSCFQVWRRNMFGFLAQKGKIITIQGSLPTIQFYLHS
jgi:hypothetical protein